MFKDCYDMRSYKRWAIALLCLMLGVFPLAAQEAGESVSIYVTPELYEQAVTAFRASDFESAIFDITLFLTLNPTHARAYYVRGISHLQAGDEPNALNDLTQSLNLGSDGDESLAAQTYYLRASVYAEQEAFDSAIADYTESIARDAIAEAYQGRALAYIEQENIDGALADLNEVLSLDETRVDVLRLRATLYNENGDVAAGSADFVDYLGRIEQDRIEGAVLIPGELTIIEAGDGVTNALPFEASAGQRVTVLALAPAGSTSDALIILLDPAGAVLIANDDGTGGTGAFITDFELTADGVYTLLVANTVADAAGQFGVAIELF